MTHSSGFFGTRSGRLDPALSRLGPTRTGVRNGAPPCLRAGTVAAGVAHREAEVA